MTSRKLTVALTESIDEAGIHKLKESADALIFESLEQTIDRQKNSITDAIIVRSVRVDASVMDSLPGLRVIGRHGAGLDNIDLNAAKSRDITVVNTPHSNTHSVAEYVMGAIYTLNKRFISASSALKNKKFSSDKGSLPGQVQRLGLAGREVSGLTIGVVGFGAIGRAVANLANANGMEISFYDPFLPENATLQPSYKRFNTLKELLQNCDVVTVHVPGDSSGEPLISYEEISQMRQDSVLINAARGSVVFLSAVVNAIREGKLRGAAVDVFDREPPELPQDVYELENLLLTPHMAAMTQEALKRMAVDVVTNTIKALEELNDEASL